ncbi:hypothetical protein NEOLEDRAFT_1132202 [Neolentinus lepideus HHB14362 ss-1]|uniref:F-box domain-containing protein n=1 Tax=Neolentinus lepideus HHB14362 ss-1 TaxID=1314782 RepID=A0A165T682_9AGAM|nr:hypothetical protein NEOLEDRAFT_1132202 [Neolentinus lepideus HHB14362 ss-1]
MAPSKASAQKTSRKRRRSESGETAMASTAGPSTAAPETGSQSNKKQKTKTAVIPPWTDIPEWETGRCPLLEMPVEILDKIFSEESHLRPQDHLAFSGTCRAIRKAYTEAVWKAMVSPYTTSYSERAIVNRIFSTALLTEASSESATEDGAAPSSQTQQSPKKGKSKAVMTHRELIVQMINYSQNLSTTEAKAKYKLTDKELLTLPFTARRNPYKRNGPPMRSFKDSRVYALAMRVHGGSLGHDAHLKKLAQRAAKTHATKTKNGTLPVRKSRPEAHIGLAMMMMLPLFLSSMYDDEDDYDDYDGVVDPEENY